MLIRKLISLTDMSKAFDSINHEILFMKLKLFGFSDPLLSLFYSFLSNRSIVVQHLNFESDQFNVPSGVPQGDHLSTLLLNIFINDIPDVTKKSRAPIVVITIIIPSLAYCQTILS